MKKIIKSIAVLTVISIVCAAVLTVANYFWKVEEPVGISPQLLEKFRTLTGDQTAQFVELETGSIDMNEDILNVYKATSGENSNVVIIQAKGTAGTFGNIVMLTAINTSDDTVIAAQKYKDETSRPVDISFDKAKGLDNNALQDTQFDVVSGSTWTSNALSYALKLSMEEYVANKEAILAAPEKSYELLTVTLRPEKALDEIESDSSIKIYIDVVSTNLKKADPEKVDFEFTLTRGGKSVTPPQSATKVSAEDNKVVYSVTIRSLKPEAYKLDVKATYKKVSASGILEFNPMPLEEKIIKRMFEGTTEVNLVDTDETTGVKVYKNNLKNFVFAYEGLKYEYGESNIYIAFDESGNISLIDGKVTDSIGFDLPDYLNIIKGKNATVFAGYVNPDEIKLDGTTQATGKYTMDVIKLTVAKICTYYTSIENLEQYLSGLGA